MSITPVKEDEGGKPREPSRNDRQGVRARLQSWLAAVGQRIRSVFAPDDGREDAQSGERAESAQIRVAGQRQLASTHESATEAADPDGPPPARGTLPGSARVDAEQNGGTLRVYNPQHDEAFIASDTWLDVEE